MNNRRTSRDRVAAFVTLLVAGALVAIAGTASVASPAAAEPKSRGATAKPAASVELLQTIQNTKNSPVNGVGARAADELPSPAAVTKARKLSVSAEGRTRTIRMLVTGYCACRECCGPNAKGITASGRPVSYNRGKFVAADTNLFPFGTRLVIPGYNQSRAVPVADRGGAIEGHHVDLFFATHQQALQWGKQWVDVTVLAD